MQRREFLKKTVTVGALAGIGSTFSMMCAKSGNQKLEKMNILLIIADDLGYKDLGCYGSTFYETPNLDRLANQGIKFTDGYAACPVCSPTRASLQTGKYPAKVKVTDWIKGRQFHTGPTVKDRWQALPFKHQLELEEITIAEILKNQGYKTFFAGKWHLGEKEEFWPENQGYDINKGGWKLGYPNLNKKEGTNGFFTPYGNPRLEDGPEGEYLPDRLADETINFLKENSHKPFFTCLSFYLVHNPLQAKDEVIKKYKEKRKAKGIDGEEEFTFDQEWMKHATTSSGRRASDDPGRGGYKERVVQGQEVYASMVESIDENIGRVLDTLKELGADKNTLIIFTSDNGGLSTAEGSPTCNLPLRGGKGWLYEGGVRVPYIIKSPNLKNAGSVNNIPISSIDVMPTILSFANIDASDYDEIDGINLMPYLETDTWPQRPLFWHYPHYANQGGNPGSAVRYGDYKLIDDFETGKKELYNLKDDIGETTDLAAENPQITAKLAKMLDDWRQSAKAKMMEPNPAWDGLEPVVDRSQN